MRGPYTDRAYDNVPQLRSAPLREYKILETLDRGYLLTNLLWPVFLTFRPLHLCFAAAALFEAVLFGGIVVALAELKLIDFVFLVISVIVVHFAVSALWFAREMHEV